MENEIITNLSMQSLMINVVIGIVVGLFVSFILKRAYRNKKKIDKGFALIYYKLSYRRKLIRNLWQLPLSFIALIAIIIIFDIHTTASVFLLSLFILSGLTHCLLLYRKWKQEERNTEM
ncbi:hypothetical protein FZC76_00550 [Sutcliffiella horikoshii]|uniref:Uncharacterized protein n=1 Tax=Sutcliffiella horikoshii TaxID=79883 RepID=A0A5D4T686_9BACI|nr:hypothetical protein [Sutcliffiella horikoshii]TYS70421.1 hypothetical protein FZC76_00550 [Sutcliffiella horikoshii]